MIRRLSKLLALSVHVVAVCAVVIITIVQFVTNYGYNMYESVAPQDLEAVLYRATNPHLTLDDSLPDCQYDILNSTRSWSPRDIPTKFDNFSAAGIVNGSFQPGHCKPQFSVALLVTYRNRQQHLDLFLPYMHNFLRKQNIHYKIYVIEQKDDKPWNKGVLYNVGAQVAISEGFPCLVLHDVDLLPLDEGNLYTCLKYPRHLSASIDKFRFVLPYSWLSGGVLSVRAGQFSRVDGMSDNFLGWGGEDDEFYKRLRAARLPLLRLSPRVSRYSMLWHRQAARNPLRRELAAAPRTAAVGGLMAARHLPARVSVSRLLTLVAVST